MFLNMQDDILNHLKNTYQPDAVILHGSRARGKERSHSDWDIILLYSQQPDVKSGRELYKEQNIEYSVHVLPADDIFEHFGAKLQGAKVLFEKGDIGTTLLKQANDYYSKGVHWSPEKIADHKLWMEGRINGMRDNVDNPIVFEKYFSDFYSRIFNYWYWILHHQHSEPIYIAEEEIAEKDSVYFSLVSILVDPTTSLAEKVGVTDKVHDRLFLASK
jgi:predicted nucleotidyltransferase